MLKRIIMWLEKRRLERENKELRLKALLIEDELKGRSGTSVPRSLTQKLRDAEKELKILQLYEQKRQQEERIEGIIRKAEEKLQKTEEKLQQPTSLAIESFTSAGNNKNVLIKWRATGAIGDILLIELLKGGMFFKSITRSIATEKGELNWAITGIPAGLKYRMRCFDKETDTEVISEEFEITR